MRKYCLKLIIASCLTPSSSALGMEEGLNTAAQFTTPEKPLVASTAPSACPSSVSVRSETGLDSPLPDMASIPVVFDATRATIQDVSSIKTLAPFFTPQDLRNLRSVSHSFSLDFEGPAHLADLKLWGNTEFLKRVQGDEADISSLQFLLEQFYSGKLEPQQYFKIARRTYPYAEGSERKDVELALRKACRSGDHFFKTAALLSKFSNSVGRSYKNSLISIYKDTTSLTERRIEAARFLGPLLEGDDRRILTEFLMNIFYSLVETPEIKMLAGRAAFPLIHPAGRPEIQSYWQGIAEDDSNHRPERSLASKFLLKYGNDAQQLNESIKYMTAFLLSPERNVPLLKKSLKYLSLEGKARFLPRILEYVSGLKGDASALEISSLALDAFSDHDFFLERSCFEDVLICGAENTKLTPFLRLKSGFHTLYLADINADKALDIILKTLESYPTDTFSLEILKRVLVLNEKEELNDALRARMDTTSNMVQKFEIANILLKWGNDDAIHDAAGVLMQQHDLSASQDKKLKILKDIYRYGNETHKNKAYTLLLQEFMTETVFEKRLDTAKTVLEFGTETGKDAMQRELIALAHGLDLDGVDQILSLLQEFGTESATRDMMPVFVSKIEKYTETYQEDPKFALKFSQIVHDLGDAMEKQIACKAALRSFQIDSNLVANFLVLAQNTVTYAFENGTPSERAFARELMLNIGFFDKTYAITNQEDLFRYTKDFLNAPGTNPARLVFIAERFLRTTYNSDFPTFYDHDLFEKANTMIVNHAEDKDILKVFLNRIFKKPALTQKTPRLFVNAANHFIQEGNIEISKKLLKILASYPSIGTAYRHVCEKALSNIGDSDYYCGLFEDAMRD